MLPLKRVRPVYFAHVVHICVMIDDLPSTKYRESRHPEVNSIFFTPHTLAVPPTHYHQTHDIFPGRFKLIAQLEKGHSDSSWADRWVSALVLELQLTRRTPGAHLPLQRLIPLTFVNT